MNTYLPNTDNVKPLGRTCFIDNTLWLAFSGSGAAFHFRGTLARVAFLADDTASIPGNENNHARVAVYVNGSRVVDEMMDAPRKEFVIFESEQAADCSVEIVKLSESAMSTVGIESISAETKDGIHPTAEKPHYIEFVGDSITCGYGMDDENPEHNFSTRTEDVTRAYSYRTAQALNADYSMVSLSGYGIISGYVNEGEPQKPEQTVPQYYEKLGFSYGKYLERTPETVKWTFDRQPDLIVINLGTNDDSYALDHADRQEIYRASYTEFLKLVRSKNPQAKILCTLGIMGGRLFPFVEKAVAAYSAETGDRNIACMKFEEQLASDGYAADWHPTAVTHGKAAEKLVRNIKELMGW